MASRMTDPTLLRRAIESVGIEKPSDYTLVLEELERLMKMELTWVQNLRSTLAGTVKFSPEMDAAVLRCFNEHYDASSALIRAATDLVQEMEEMGYGKTSDRALPGSYDNLLAALKEVKG